MSATTSPPDTVAAIWRAVQSGARWAMTGIQTLGTDWATIKANPLYGPLVTMAAQTAVNELAAQGVPVAESVNLGLAVEHEVAALAAAHPGIATP